MNSEIANRFVTMRKQYQLTQEELAWRLEVTPRDVARWEQGAASPEPEILLKLAGVYGVSLDALLAGPAVGTDAPQPNGPAPALPPSEYIPLPDPPEPAAFEQILKILHPAYPCIIVFVYSLLGVFRGWWHPAWVLFLTIPIFYTVFRKPK
jgi:transcriptional regulator with XRE-family HTH domain